MKVIFDVMHLYYLPQYLPVAAELIGRGVTPQFMFHRSEESRLNQICEGVIVSHSLSAVWCGSVAEAQQQYLKLKPDWIIFGNAVSDIDKLHEVSKTALMQHGIGPKSCYYDVSENATTVRFIEGQHRLKRLQTLYPASNFVDTGYAKLDPIVQNQQFDLSVESLGLDPTKKTLLYAPTFYPSSIEKFSKRFAKDFSQYNIILKPHFFSLTKTKYGKQRNLLESWAKSDNVYLAKIEDFNLTPFMAIADLLISDASSAIFEFAAIQKPVVWCDFYQLRWSYRGIFKFRFTNRLDSDIEFFKEVAHQAKSYSELAIAIKEAFDETAPMQARKSIVVEQLAGKIDGKCSRRIVDYLIQN
jgi:hypothetical protein